jgi:hypothetical protein
MNSPTLQVAPFVFDSGSVFSIFEGWSPSLPGQAGCDTYDLLRNENIRMVNRFERDAVNAIPGGWRLPNVNTESQTVLPLLPGWTNAGNFIPGLADYATRYRVDVSGVPAGVTVHLPVQWGPNDNMQASIGNDFDLFLPYPNGFGGLPVTSPGISLTYEYRVPTGNIVDIFKVPITVNVTPGNFSPGTIMLGITYAPNTTDFPFNNAKIANLPYFKDTSASTKIPLAKIAACGGSAVALQINGVTSPAPSAFITGAIGGPIPPVTVMAQDANGNISPSASSVRVQSTPAGIDTTGNLVNGLLTLNGLIFNNPGTYTLTATSPGLTSATSPPIRVSVPGPCPMGNYCSIATAAHLLGLSRSGSSFLLDTPGLYTYQAGQTRFIPNFSGPGGFQTGDMPVSGDWTGDGKWKVGIYRQPTGQWFLDANNNGIYDAGDATYNFGGVSGDVPVSGDWTGIGRTCIGVFRQGFFWVLDLNCNGKFDDVPTDAAFPFGGVSGDKPVVGDWTGSGATKVGVVRKYVPNGVPQGNPFFWVPDAGAANAGSSPDKHQPDYRRCFPFGGLDGDVFITGDWYGTGKSTAAVYRNGLWVIDVALPESPLAAHLQPPLQFSFGGGLSDIPIVGNW